MKPQGGIWTAGPERGKLLSWKEGNGAKKEDGNKNGRKYVLGDKSYSGFDAMVLPEFAKKGEYAARRELFSGIWKLGGIEEFRNKGWSREAFKEDRRLQEVSGILDVPLCKGTGMWLFTFTFLFFYKLKSQKSLAFKACKLVKVKHRLPVISCLSMCSTLFLLCMYTLKEYFLLL